MAANLPNTAQNRHDHAPFGTQPLVHTEGLTHSLAITSRVDRSDLAEMLGKRYAGAIRFEWWVSMNVVHEPEMYPHHGLRN